MILHLCTGAYGDVVARKLALLMAAAKSRTFFKKRRTTKAPRPPNRSISLSDLELGKISVCGQTRLDHGNVTDSSLSCPIWIHSVSDSHAGSGPAPTSNALAASGCP